VPVHKYYQLRDAGKELYVLTQEETFPVRCSVLSREVFGSFKGELYENFNDD